MFSNETLRACRAQLRLVRYHPRGMATWWVCALLVLLALLIAFMGVVIGARNAAVGVGLVVLILGGLLFGGYLTTLVSTTGGSLQQTVPNLARVQAGLTAALLLALSAMAILLTGLMFGAPASLWSVIVIGLWSCTVLAPAMGFVFIVVCSGLIPAWKGLPPAMRAVLAGPPGYLFAAGISILVALVVLPAFLRRRQTRHGYAVEVAHTSTERIVHAGISGGPHWIYHWLARNTVRRREPAGLVLLALGPKGHWGNALLVGLVSTVIAIVMTFKIDLGSPYDAQVGVSAVTQLAFAAILFIVAVQVQALLTSIYARRGEQALLRLAPAAPPRAAFNRELGLALLKRVAIGWALMVGLVLLFGCVAGATPRSMLNGFAFACIALLLLPTTLRDFGQMDEAKNYLVGILEMIVLVGLIVAAAVIPHLRLVLAPASVVIALLLCWRRLDAAAKAAPMFPSGSART